MHFDRQHDCSRLADVNHNDVTRLNEVTSTSAFHCSQQHQPCDDVSRRTQADVTVCTSPRRSILKKSSTPCSDGAASKHHHYHHHHQQQQPVRRSSLMCAEQVRADGQRLVAPVHGSHRDVTKRVKFCV